MDIRTIIKRFLPSFRATQPVLEYCRSLSNDINKLNNRIDDLDYKYEYLYLLSQKLIGETDMDTRKRIFLEMPKATGTLREIQIAENEILKRIKKICDENDIKFFLLWGTLLGAVRHKGFIPWDDDIDIGMMYNDYLSFVQAVENDPIIEVNNYYNSGGMKIVKVKFRIIDSVFVDIFLFDNLEVSEGDFLHKKGIIKQQYEKYKKIFSANVADYYKSYSECIPIKNNHNDKLLNELREQFCFDNEYYGTGNAVCLSADNFWRDEFYATDDVFPLNTNEAEFEGQQYPIWNNCFKYLKDIYGDIWSLPRSIKAHHLDEIMVDIEQDLLRIKQLTE